MSGTNQSECRYGEGREKGRKSSCKLSKQGLSVKGFDRKKEGKKREVCGKEPFEV